MIHVVSGSLGCKLRSESMRTVRFMPHVSFLYASLNGSSPDDMHAMTFQPGLSYQKCSRSLQEDFTNNMQADPPITAIVKGPLARRGCRKNLQCGSSAGAAAAAAPARCPPAARRCGLLMPATASTSSIKMAHAVSHLALRRTAADHRGCAPALWGLTTWNEPPPSGSAGCRPPARNIQLYAGTVSITRCAMGSCLASGRLHTLHLCQRNHQQRFYVAALDAT